MKALPTDLRSFLTPDITEPEIDVFDAFFAVPDADPTRRQGPGGKPDVNPPPPPPPPPPRIPAIKVKTLEDGFRLEATPDYTDWPVSVSVYIAYADGSRNPPWSEYDFTPEELETVANDCHYSFTTSSKRKTCRLVVKDFRGSGSLQVTGFDNRRELETRIKVMKNAQDN